MQKTQKANSVATSTFDAVAGVLTVEVIGGGKLTFNVREFVAAEGFDKLNENGKRAVGHGVNQRLMDRAAIGRDATTGQSATPAEKFAAIKALADHYAGGGEWTMGRGDGLKPLDRAALFAAIAKVRKVAPDKVASVYASKEDTVLRTFLTIKDIAAEYARMTTRQPEDKSKVNELFAELDKAA